TERKPRSFSPVGTSMQNVVDLGQSKPRQNRCHLADEYSFLLFPLA
ncbi:hypothetical protein D041_0487B, partial [Vibrio parahaemolyticus EKP-008]